MFLIINSLKNIIRQRARYRLFVPLLLVCSLLSSLFLGILTPCRNYSEQTAFDSPFAITQEKDEQNKNSSQLALTASMIETGVIAVSAIAILYVSSLMTGERIRETGVLYSLGLTKGQIFLSFFIEIAAVSILSFVMGTICGKFLSHTYLNSMILSGELPVNLLSFKQSGGEIVQFIYAIVILLIPISGMAARIIRSEPADIMRNSK